MFNLFGLTSIELKTQLPTQLNELKGQWTISTLQLHVLPRFHLAPIKLIVYQCPRKPNLEVSFALNMLSALI